MTKTLSILIPVYNEEAFIQALIERVYSADLLGYKKQVIVIDDKSTDKTLQILQNLQKKYKFILESHPENRGKGGGIKTGLKKAKGDLIITQDGDLEYHPDDIKNLLKVYQKDSDPVIYGSRNLGPSKKGYLLTHFAGSLITALFNLLYGTKLTDLHTGYKLFRADLIQNASLQTNGFDFCHEITAKVIKKGYKIKEVPISYSARKFSEGKKVNLLDAFIDIWTVIKMRFSVLKTQ